MQKLTSSSTFVRCALTRKFCFCSMPTPLLWNKRHKLSTKICLDNFNTPCGMFQEIERIGRLSQRLYSEIKNNNSTGYISESAYEKICEETLEALNDYFEEIMVNFSPDPESDVSLNNGVLTVNLGQGKGTYIINKQTPNKQIWLSSPFSGPKRYDLIQQQWIYHHDNTTLHELLSTEMSRFFKRPIDFRKLLSSTH